MARPTLGQLTWPTFFSISGIRKNRMLALCLLLFSSSSAIDLSLSVTFFMGFTLHTTLVHSSLVISHLHDVSTTFSNSRNKSKHIIVDALDECPDNMGIRSSREKVLDLVEELVGLDLPNLRLCVTSRPEVDIQTVLEPLTSTSSRISLHDELGQKQDIIDYINSVVRSDRKMKRWREEDKKLIIQTLSSRAHGM